MAVAPPTSISPSLRGSYLQGAILDLACAHTHDRATLLVTANPGFVAEYLARSASPVTVVAPDSARAERMRSALQTLVEGEQSYQLCAGSAEALAQRPPPGWGRLQWFSDDFRHWSTWLDAFDAALAPESELVLLVPRLWGSLIALAGRGRPGGWPAPGFRRTLAQRGYRIEHELPLEGITSWVAALLVRATQLLGRADLADRWERAYLERVLYPRSMTLAGYSLLFLRKSARGAH